ncbi:hypothetical protein, conserved [Babesia bigemina]|uniref:Uncharacterized protein n=1 Tax=Babesia bigemina TaxID=5866 RepID=A0A061D2J6_BABBI|nr:hypothetical protein, conserved [Babesia bigemina]CDR94808.1 hypothetical protein, conserved [Babesia bigemina]|eukprot:XP_012766994.1 hypothetical protein, conserved [Babesia bigemina]
MKTVALSVTAALALCCVGVFEAGCAEETYTFPDDYAGRSSGSGSIETIHFASYTPSQHQIEFAKRSIADDESRETMKKLVEILRQSTAGQSQADTIEDYSNEFENEPVADAAYETSDRGSAVSTELGATAGSAGRYHAAQPAHDVNGNPHTAFNQISSGVQVSVNHGLINSHLHEIPEPHFEEIHAHDSHGSHAQEEPSAHRQPISGRGRHLGHVATHENALHAHPSFVAYTPSAHHDNAAHGNAHQDQHYPYHQPSHGGEFIAGHATHNHAEIGPHHAEHAPDQEAVQLVNRMCQALVRNPEYMAFCRNPVVQDIIRENPQILDEQYSIDILGQHLQPTNNDMVTDFRDGHSVSQSMRYFISKICVGPLPAACNNVALHA